MKKRGEVDEEEEKDIFIDDEPDDGPSHYILLIGFSEANLLREGFKIVLCFPIIDWFYRMERASEIH